MITSRQVHYQPAKQIELTQISLQPTDFLTSSRTRITYSCSLFFLLSALWTACIGTAPPALTRLKLETRICAHGDKIRDQKYPCSSGCCVESLRGTNNQHTVGLLYTSLACLVFTRTRTHVWLRIRKQDNRSQGKGGKFKIASWSASWVLLLFDRNFFASDPKVRTHPSFKTKKLWCCGMCFNTRKEFKIGFHA